MVRRYNNLKTISTQMEAFTTSFPDLENAACYKNGIDPEVYFPRPSKMTKENRQAKKLCVACPCMLECLEFALVNDERHGIWGGTTPHERQRLLGRGGTVNALESGHVIERGRLPAPNWRRVETAGESPQYKWIPTT
jgi:WhiB family redox-sensing transcriptional regulator